jgi:hypothetical protein
MKAKKSYVRVFGSGRFMFLSLLRSAHRVLLGRHTKTEPNKIAMLRADSAKS